MISAFGERLRPDSGHTNLYDSRVESRTMVNNPSQGALFHQYSDRVEVLGDPDQSVAFDKVVGTDCAMQKDIVAASLTLRSTLQQRAAARRYSEPRIGDVRF